jgi:hypothetical protein
VVTAFEFKLAEVDIILGGALMLPATAEALEGYLDYSLRAPEELTTITMMMAAPPRHSCPPSWLANRSLLVWPPTRVTRPRASRPSSRCATWAPWST